MIKVLFVITNLTSGGIQTQVLLLAKYFQEELGMNVTIWGTHSVQENFTQILESEKVKYEFRKDIDFIFSRDYFQLSRVKQFKTWIPLIKNLNKEKFDIVLPYGGTDLIFNIAKPFTKIKVSFHFQRGGHPAPSKRKFDFYRWIAKKTNPVYVANSEHGAKAFSIIENIPEKKIKVIKNAFIPKSNSVATEEWERQYEKLLKSKVVVSMVSNFFDGKDHETVIRAWQSIDKTKNSVLVFAGLGGPVSCHKNFENAKKLAYSLNLQNSILFLGNVKNTKKLLDFTDIGLLSSISEGCPNAILEYMGAVLPIIGTDIPGIREIIHPDNKQFLFPVGDIEKCANQLEMLMNNTNLRTNLGKKNKMYVNENFKPEKMYKAYHNILKDKKIV